MKFIFKLSNAVTVGFSISIIDIFFFKKSQMQKEQAGRQSKAMYGQALSWYTYYNIRFWRSWQAHYVWFSWFWSHLKMSEKCVLGGCTITSKNKINVFWNFFSLEWGHSVWKIKKRWFSPLRQTVQCPAKMRPKLWKSHIVQAAIFSHFF